MKKILAGTAMSGIMGAAAAASQLVPQPISHLFYGGADGKGAAQAAGAAITTIGILTGQPEVALVGFILYTMSQ